MLKQRSGLGAVLSLPKTTLGERSRRSVRGSGLARRSKIAPNAMNSCHWQWIVGTYVGAWSTHGGLLVEYSGDDLACVSPCLTGSATQTSS